jgi:hypothetical protein
MPLGRVLGRRILLAGLDDPTHQTQADHDQSARDDPALGDSETGRCVCQADNDQERTNEVDNHVGHELPLQRHRKSAASDAATVTPAA